MSKAPLHTLIDTFYQKVDPQYQEKVNTFKRSTGGRTSLDKELNCLDESTHTDLLAFVQLIEYQFGVACKVYTLMAQELLQSGDRSLVRKCIDHYYNKVASLDYFDKLRTHTQECKRRFIVKKRQSCSDDTTRHQLLTDARMRRLQLNTAQKVYTLMATKLLHSHKSVTHRRGNEHTIRSRPTLTDMRLPVHKARGHDSTQSHSQLELQDTYEQDLPVGFSSHCTTIHGRSQKHRVPKVYTFATSPRSMPVLTSPIPFAATDMRLPVHKARGHDSTQSHSQLELQDTYEQDLPVGFSSHCTTIHGRSQKHRVPKVYTFATSPRSMPVLTSPIPFAVPTTAANSVSTKHRDMRVHHTLHASPASPIPSAPLIGTGGSSPAYEPGQSTPRSSKEYKTKNTRITNVYAEDVVQSEADAALAWRQVVADARNGQLTNLEVELHHEALQSAVTRIRKGTKRKRVHGIESGT